MAGATGASHGGWPRHVAFYIGAAVGLAALAGSLLLFPVYAVAIGANGFFAAYLATTAWQLPSLTPAFLRSRGADADAPVLAIFAVVVLVVGLAVAFLFLAMNGRGVADPVAIAASAVSVVLGWFAIHTMAALHYAYEFYDAPPDSLDGPGVAGGLQFPGGDDEPGAGAFLYFSYVVGMTAQVSDVLVTSVGMRRRVMWHGVFSFFFNTVILAATVNVGVTLAGN